MFQFIDRLFSSSDFMPHGHCYFWRPEVLWLHVVSDALIALSYFSIPLALVYLVRKRTDLPFPWLFALFGVFIVACGTTHVLAIVTVWDPIYRLDGVVKAITAVASVGTAAALIPIIPRALGLASPTQLLAANALLEQEVAARKQAQAQLAQVHEETESRVRERTAELAEAVERYQESEARLNAVLAAAPVFLFATDVAGTFTFAEGKGIGTLELPPTHRVGRSINELYRDHPEVIASFQKAVSGEAVEAEVPLGDMTMDLRFAPNREPDGTITGVTGIGVDVTAAKNAREALRQAKEDAEHANNAKSEFLSRMSHELRTPLNAVLGFAQLLQMSITQPKAVHSIEHILKAGRHLLALIDEVLDISRIETGRLELTLEPLSVYDTAFTALKLLEPIARPRNIRLELAEGFPAVHLLADKLRFHQALLNLLSNAVKFNQEGGAVVVSCERRGDRVRVFVTDTGPGISAGDLGKLFTPFERLDANERNIDGSGIGLALSKRLIESQDGHIGVESRLGVGSTFWIDLPFAETPVARVQAEASVGSPAKPDTAEPETLTVLYIEDNVSNLTLVEFIFEQYPQVRLIAAMQGILGLEMARQHRPNLILLDLQLPDIKGDEVLRRLQADPQTKRIPVIMLSADATTLQIERLRDAGVRAYLTKPLDVRKFLTVVDAELHLDGARPTLDATTGVDGK